MEDGRLGSGQFRRKNALRGKGEHVTVDSHGFVYLADFLIGGFFQSEGAARAEKLGDHAVEVLGTGADNHLAGADLDAPAPAQVRADFRAEFPAAVVGGFNQDVLAVIQEYPAHGFRQDTVGKFTDRMGLGVGKLQLGLSRLRDSLEVCLSVDDEAAASLFGFNIAFVAEKVHGMFHGNDADSGFLGDDAFGGKAGIQGVNACHDILDKVVIKLEVGRNTAVSFNGIIHLVILKTPVLVISILPIRLYSG